MITEEIKKQIESLAEYFEVSTDSITYDEDYNTFNVPGYGEFMVFESYDDAKNKAVELCKDFIDSEGISGINFDYLGGIDQYVNKDWFDEAMRESYESYIEDITDEIHHVDENGNEVTRLQFEMEMYRCATPEEYLDTLCDQDSIEYFKNDFGDTAFNEVIMENELLNVDMVAEQVVEVDGIAHQLASYDGFEICLPEGRYAYRIN